MVARELVVFMKRSGGQGQYSEPLKFQIESTEQHGRKLQPTFDPTSQAIFLSVLWLAWFHLSPRQFSRRFYPPLSVILLQRTSKPSDLTKLAHVCATRNATSRINSPCRSDSR